jgi:hypothetical protein
MSHEREGRYRESGGADTPGTVTELAPGKRTLTQALETPMHAPGSPAHPVQRRLRNAPSVGADLDLDAAPIADGLAAAFLAPRSPVQAKAAALIETEPQQVHAAAERGTATPSTTLPYRAELEASLGHDLSGVQAHVGGAAEKAAADMGAEAFATGDHVVLPANPSLHTVAHEVAHVVQQRDGVQLAGGVGAAGDVYERHADTVADRVVRGEPSGDLVTGTTAAGPVSSAVQKQESAAPAAAEAEAPYEPSWDDIVAASTGDDDAMDALDIAWIDSLPEDLPTQIDRSFAVSKQHAVVKLLMKKRTAAIKAQHKKDVATLDRDTKARLGKGARIKDDEQYKVARAALDDNQAQELEAASAVAQTEAGAKSQKVETTSSAVAAPDKELPWMQGRLLARVNFVAWGSYVLGSTAKLKAHYAGVASVPGASSIVLSQDATARFVSARAWFEAQFPGNTFLRRGGGLQIRNRHQGDHAKGKLGHPLGIAVDFDATANPHQKDKVAQFMLRQFGGTPAASPGAAREEGANSMELPEGSARTVEAMGDAMDEGDALTKRQLAFLTQAQAAYEEMFATSERFQDSLRDQMPALRKAQEVYLTVVRPGQHRLVEVQRNLGRLRKKSRNASDPKIAALQAEEIQLKATVGAAHAGVSATMLSAFSPWIGEMQGFVDKAKQDHGADMSMKVDAATARSLVPQIQKATQPRQLKRFLADSKSKAIFAGFDADLIDQSFEAARDAMAARAEEVANARTAAAGVWFRQELIERLTADPVAVFGTGSDVVADPSVMQYLEKGFVRHDELNRPGDGVDDNKIREVFNGEFMKAMLMHGWYTGAAWNSSVDTMHFDFLEGYAAIVNSGGDDKMYGPTD